MAGEYNGSHMHTQTVTVEGEICTEDGSLSDNGFSGSPWVLFWMNCFKSYRNITNHKRRSLALEGRRRFCMETTCVTKRTNSLTPPSLSYLGASQRRRHWLAALGKASQASRDGICCCQITLKNVQALQRRAKCLSSVKAIY